MAAPPFEISLAEVSSLDERQEFVSMVGVQQMVRATCLQVMGAPPGQLAEYRREVLELHALIQGFRSDVQDLKRVQQQQQQVFPPSSPSVESANGSMASEETLLADATDTVLRMTWEEMPTRSWYEGRPLPLFAVRLDAEHGGGATAPNGIRLRASFLNGRGGVEETKANGTSALVGGERYAHVAGGRAIWEQLVVCEASSKHYGNFTIIIDAVELPPHVRVRELRSEPLQVQVGRMWSKRRKADDEISPEDSINQIPGVGCTPRPNTTTCACPCPCPCRAMHAPCTCTRHAHAHAVHAPRTGGQPLRGATAAAGRDVHRPIRGDGRHA